MLQTKLQKAKKETYLWCLHKMGAGREVLKDCRMFVDFIILNIRSIVHFRGWWKWEGHLFFVTSYMGDLKDNNTKKKKCLESKRVRYSQNVKFNYKTNRNLIISPFTQISRTNPSSGIYFFKAKSGNTRTIYGICSKLTTIKMPERSQ